NGDALGANQGGHLVLYRDVHLDAGHVQSIGQRAWTSTHAYWVRHRPHYPEMIAIGSRSIAFSFQPGRLWIAPIDGAEHPVALDENPVFWTSNGDLITSTFRNGGDALRLRDAGGRLIRTITTWTHRYAIDEGHDSIIYLRHGRLLRFDGVRSRALRDLRSLGLGW